MLAEFSVTPVGAGVHLSKEIAKAIRVVKESGLDYQVTAMGTLVEGSAEEILRVIGKAHQTLLRDNERVYTRIVLDEFQKETPGRLRSKVAKVEQELGVALKK
jgi:uncharacterized protein (TIGR00106 family)